MKPVLEHLPREAGESFVVRQFEYAYFPTPWHFHPEFELVLVTESTGRRFIGDNISNFGAGDLALIGPYLPHFYRNDPNYYQADAGIQAKSIVVHFLADSFGKEFLVLPEMKKIHQMLAASRQGIGFNGATRDTAATKLEKLAQLKGVSRWLLLVEILQILSESSDYYYISTGVVQGENTNEKERMDAVLHFVQKNFQREIRLNEVASLVNMAENSFSRYFMQRTRKTFTRYVNEVRLGEASKQLVMTNQPIADIAYQCGFNNLSNFNRQFIRMHKMAPLHYRKLYLQRI